MKTIALAYSGGLDTSIIVPWLKEHYDAKVVCVLGSGGSGEGEDGGTRQQQSFHERGNRPAVSWLQGRIIRPHGPFTPSDVR